MIDKVNKQLKYEKALEYEIFVKGEYNFAIGKIKEANYIFDIWWHIWLFSKWCRSLNPNVEIHYFEPVVNFCSRAKKEFEDDSHILINNYWISSGSWVWTLLLNQEKTMQSSKYYSFLNLDWREVVVDFITLKEYLDQVKLDKIDVLKMDIEWMEFDVLSSWSDFEFWKIDNLIVEVHLLNRKIEDERSNIFLKIKNFFWNVEIINSCYCREIFLIRANK